MVCRETCEHCKGNKYVRVTTTSGQHKNTQCPQCGGSGFKIRVTLTSSARR